MRFALAAIAAALPALSAAQEGPLDQYVAKFQNFIGNMGSYVPNPGAHDPIAAMEAKVGSMKLSVLTLDNWKQTLYDSVSPGATKPEEWWVLITGRNKTCWGRCGQLETAFNETAGKFAVLPGAPRMGLVNCDDQPILCNSWAAATGAVWIFEMLPPPAEIEIYARGFNLSSVTSSTLVTSHAAGSKNNLKPLDSWFHPFNGKATELGLSVPYAYLTWGFGLVPNWLFMLVVSFASRSMMSNRMAPPNRAPGGPPGGAAPRPAQ